MNVHPSTQVGSIAILAVFCLVPTLIAAGIQSRVRTRCLFEQLSSVGFERLDPDSNLEPELERALGDMKPHGLTPRNRRLLLHGVVDGREIWISEHKVPAGKTSLQLTATAVQSDRAWTPGIIRRRTIFDGVSDRHDFGHVPFDRQREVRGESPPTSRFELAPLVEWFITDWDRMPSPGFRRTPGKREQWSFHGRWAVRADLGVTTPDTLPALGRFMVRFAEAAEEAMSDNQRLQSF